MSALLPPKPEVLLLDAGNTLVFMDADAIADVVGFPALDGDAIIKAVPTAKKVYEAFLERTKDHDEGWFVFMSALLLRAGAPQQGLEELVKHVRASHDEFNFWRKVRPGTVEALESLRAGGIRLGVVSNSEGVIDQLLERVGLASFFEVMVDSAVEGVSKPDPRIFEIALSRMNAEPGSAIYVGDVHEVDVVGARKAGLDAILIDGYDHHRDYTDAPRIQRLGELVTAWC